MTGQRTRCQGHLPGPCEPMGQTVYCDGSCAHIRERATATATDTVTAQPAVVKTGRRFYAVAFPFALKDKLKALGCSWDTEARCWWTGKAEVAGQMQALLAEPLPAIGRWTKVGDEWVVTGDEAALRSGKVRVQARDKPAQDVAVTDVRRYGDMWIASRVSTGGSRPRGSFRGRRTG